MKCYQYVKVLGLGKLNNLFMKLISMLIKPDSSLLVWLYTEHITLNKHLHHIDRVDTLNCPYYNNKPNPPLKTVKHIIFQCSNYAHERHKLHNLTGCGASSLPFLLTTPCMITPLINFSKALKDYIPYSLPNSNSH